MKSSSVVASFLFGSLALAAPLDKRALVTHVEVVTETVIIYTTVWAGEEPSTAPAVVTSAPGLFYEQRPSKPASSKAEPTSEPAPAYTPPVVINSPEPSSTSVYTPPPPPPPSSTYTPPPAPVYTPPAAPVSSSPPPPASSAPATGKPSGQQYHGDITIFDNDGSLGACGKPQYDDQEICALSIATYGKSTYDVATGNPTNPWCFTKITLEYNGRTADCVITDMCPGCSGADVDLSYSVWKKLTGTDEKTRFQANWWVSG